MYSVNPYTVVPMSPLRAGIEMVAAIPTIMTVVHTVCARVTQDFLDYLKGQGNDLITPHPQHGFPGLKPGDQWCVCAASWRA